MSIDPRHLTVWLKNSKSLAELRKSANEHSSIMSAVHDSVICVACGRFGSIDERLRNECRVFYLLAAGMWLNRPEGSFGREARAIANILHAGAKLRIDSQNEVMRKLFEEAMRLSDGFEAQGASNAIWAAATMELLAILISQKLLVQPRYSELKFILVTISSTHSYFISKYHSFLYFLVRKFCISFFVAEVLFIDIGKKDQKSLQ